MRRPIQTLAHRSWLVLVCCVGAVLVIPSPVQGGPPADPGHREAVGPYLDGRLPRSSPVPSGGWRAVPAFPFLTFQDPTFLVAEPGGQRLYVGTRQGLIEAFDADPNASSKVSVLDLRSTCQGFDDSGLMGLAFHPEFARPGSPNRGYFYVFYNYTEAPAKGPDRPENRSTTNRLSRFTVPDGSTVADPNSELVLIDQADENLWHNGGGLFFHPKDGFLYLSLGDEGGDYGNTQRIDRDLFSGVIRIDVDRRGGSISRPIVRRPESGSTDHYYIPIDNPWVGVENALEEFWCIGLRSPHRMTVDPPTGRIWLGDVGEGSREEVDIIEKGGNYQWRYREGTAPAPDARPRPLIGRDSPPIHDYGHDQGSAIIGGYVYRGAEHARDLVGKYVFADQGGRIWALTYDETRKKAKVEHLCDLASAPSRSYGTGISSFGLDHSGELYICRMGDQGAIFKLARTGLTANDWPKTLAKVRAFRDLKTLEPVPGLLDYEVNAPLWSDGASKSRWVAAPKGQIIGFAPERPWTFPAGTVFIKHFEIATDETRPDAPKRRLETRFLVRDANGSTFGATYRWRLDGSDADLLEASRTEDITIKTASGKRVQTWTYPSPHDCLTCHTPAAGYVLGVNARQLNRPKAGVTENQLVEWGREGLLSSGFDPAKVATYPRLVSLDDPNAPIEAKVRSYLDSNCAHCHRPDGVRARFDARFETRLSIQGLIDASALNPLKFESPRLVAPGDPARSMLHYRLESNDPATRMPPLARNRPDDPAIAVVRAWIEGLPASSKRPEVRLTRLKPRWELGTEVTLTAEVAGEGIVKVEFFQGATSIGQARPSKPSINWKAGPVGSHFLTARVTDARGISATSEGLIVTVDPPAPPGEGPLTYLDDLPWIEATSGHGPVERKRSNGEANAHDGRTIRIRGKSFDRGLGVHAPSEIRFAIDGTLALFLADVGVDDETSGEGRVEFQVWADGSKLFDSGPLTGRSKLKNIRVDVTGKRELTLIVTDAGDGIGSDHADWAGARLLKPINGIK